MTSTTNDSILHPPMICDQVALSSSPRLIRNNMKYVDEVMQESTQDLGMTLNTLLVDYNVISNEAIKNGCVIHSLSFILNVVNMHSNEKRFSCGYGVI